MKAIIIFDGRFFNNSGRPSSYHLTYEKFSQRYLTEFSEIEIVGRLYENEDSSAKPIDGDKVTFHGVPGYNGLLGFIASIPKILASLYSLDRKGKVIIYRTPGTIPFLDWILFSSFRRRHYSVEVVADPFDQLSKGTTKNFFRPIFQRLFTFLLKRQCWQASAAAYVTEFALQTRYPNKRHSSHHFTSLNLPASWLCAEPRVYKDGKKYKLVCVGMMSKLYKGQDTLIDAAKILKAKNLDFEIAFIGEGDFEKYLQKRSEASGLKENISFIGKVSHGQDIIDILDASDIYVMPSRQEGLPRAIIEAMARGLPVISTDVGGISELVPLRYLVPPNAPAALADKILEVIQSSKLEEMSAENLIRAQNYTLDKVQARRNLFYLEAKKKIE